MNTQLFIASDIINKYQRLKKFRLEAIWSDGYLKDSGYTVLSFGRFIINLKTGTQILTTFYGYLNLMVPRVINTQEDMCIFQPNKVKEGHT